MCQAIKYTQQMINIFYDVNKRYNSNIKELEQLNGRIQDIEHEIELTRFNACRGYYLAKELKEARVRRRELKDENDTLIFLKDIVDKNENFRKQVHDVHGKINKEIKAKQERKYVPRQKQLNYDWAAKLREVRV